MKKRNMTSRVLLAVGIATTTLQACDTEDATMAVVENGYPMVDAATVNPLVVYKAWWVATLFKDPILAGKTSDEARSVPQSDFAYALLAPGWNPALGVAPARLVAMKSKQKLTVARGDTLHIVVSDTSFLGNCDGGQPLSQEDADFVTQRVFADDFAAVSYDAKTCLATARQAGAELADAGASVAADAGNDAQGDAIR